MLCHKVKIGRQLAGKAIPFSKQSNDYTKTLLVLGDSTAVGVGASSPISSLPALVSEYIGATYVENHAVSGATVNDMAQQLPLTQRSSYDMILIHIGANDIRRFHDVEMVSKELQNITISLKDKSSQIIFLSAGNLGGASIIPFFIQSLYTRLNLKYHRYFEEIAKTIHVTYVNMYIDPKIDPFVQYPKQYLAKDGFHPSDDGYKLWFTMIQKVLIHSR